MSILNRIIHGKPGRKEEVANALFQADMTMFIDAGMKIVYEPEREAALLARAKTTERELLQFGFLKEHGMTDAEAEKMSMKDFRSRKYWENDKIVAAYERYEAAHTNDKRGASK